MLIIFIKIYFAVLIMIPGVLAAQGNTILMVNLKENDGLNRNLEYVEISCQFPVDQLGDMNFNLIAQESNSGEIIECQISYLQTDSRDQRILAEIIFPVTCGAFEEKHYKIKTEKTKRILPEEIKLSGQGTELVIENKFYRADLRKSDDAEGHSYMSGQIRELLIKMGFDQLLINVEDRLHWAPNFKRPELEFYTTIAHWQMPRINVVNTGPYQISTLRQDLAPDHSEILLTAKYRFYAELPYFRFFSSMEMIDNVWLELLRNDEMAMDSMFTHVAFKRPNGEIIDVPFSERYDLLKERPIENDCPWLCFYNIENGFAFGSIRINYDITNMFGGISPTFQPHTQIGEWLNGIKYWNRRLVHDHLTFIPKGSYYSEDNAYIVFSIKDPDKLEDIRYWADRIQHPLQVKIQYP